MNEEQPRKRRRIDSGEQASRVVGTEEFVGAAAMAAAPEVELEGPSLDDTLDGSGRPYRDADEHRQADPRLPGGWGRIVRTVFKIDERDAWKKCSDVQFAVPPSKLEYGELTDELDTASGRVVLASQLYQNAKAVLGRYESDVEVILAPMHRQAREDLERSKPEKGGKAITDADVRARIAELWPDEIRRQQDNLTRAKGTVAHCSNMFDRWVARAREIDGMVRSNRRL